MLLMNRDYPLSISLDQNTYRNAEEFAKAGFEAAECCLPTYYRDPVDLSIFEPFLNEVYPHIRAAGLRIAAYHLPFGTYWDLSSPDEAIRTAAVEANAALIRLLAPLEGGNVVSIPVSSRLGKPSARRTSPPARRACASSAPLPESSASESLWKTCRAPVWAGRRRKWSA